MCRRGISTFFPIELLTVADYQRVKNGMLNSTDIKQIIRFCAIPPHSKRDEIQRSYDAFNINNDEFCKNAGISVTEQPLKVTARVLTPPQIFYANGQVNVAEGCWRMPKFAKYIATASCQKWVVVLVD
uniref:Argonaute linker 2 domain-containing protein n=1 Tax=Panagrolaimus sp. ES5 TaxID=591445 RepID=A0AC34GMS9_9BILA